MKRSEFSRETVCINSLAVSYKRDLSDTLFQEVYQHLWGGSHEDEFYRNFFEADCSLAKVQVYRHNLKIVGYLIFRVIELETDGQHFSALRISTNILPRFQGNDLTNFFIFKESIRYWSNHIIPRRKMAVVFAAAGPASYCGFAKRVRRVYPNPYHDTPRRYDKLMKDVAKKLRFEFEDEGKGTIFFPGRFEKNKKSYVCRDQKSKELLDFYQKSCPNSGQGQALLVLSPGEILDAFYAIAFHSHRFLSQHRLAKKLRLQFDYFLGKGSSHQTLEKVSAKK